MGGGAAQIPVSLPPSGWPSPSPTPSELLEHGGVAGSLQPVGSEGVLHSRVGEHQVAVQHVESQGVHPEGVVQREGIHLKAGDVGQSAGDLFRQTRRGVACREGGTADMLDFQEIKPERKLQNTRLVNHLLLNS